MTEGDAGRRSPQPHGPRPEIMKEPLIPRFRPPVRSMGGLIGGEAESWLPTRPSDAASAAMSEKAITYAVAVLETNASMGPIVAAPTAGSAGVVPDCSWHRRNATASPMKTSSSPVQCRCHWLPGYGKPP